MGVEGQIVAEASRDRIEIGNGPHVRADVSCRWKALRIVALIISSRRGQSNGLGDISETSSTLERDGRDEEGSRQGCQRYGSVEVRGRNTSRMNPKWPAEASQAS